MRAAKRNSGIDRKFIAVTLCRALNALSRAYPGSNRLELLNRKFQKSVRVHAKIFFARIAPRQGLGKGASYNDFKLNATESEGADYPSTHLRSLIS